MAKFKCTMNSADYLETFPGVDNRTFGFDLYQWDEISAVVLSFKSVERLHKKLGKFIEKVYAAEDEETNGPRTTNSFGNLNSY